MESAPPLRRMYDLRDLSQAGDEVALAAGAEECAAIARWAGVEAVRAFGATVALRKLSATRFRLDVDYAADIVQACVVTLDPVESRVTGRFSRELHYTSRPEAPAGELALSESEEEGPEEIASFQYDLAAPVLEEFALAIDPYPRAPGVAFEPPADESEEPESPFAILRKLAEPR